MMDWRNTMAHRTTFWILVLVLGAAAEMHDEVLPVGLDSEMGDNYIDTVPLVPPNVEVPVKELLLYNMMKSLGSHDTHPMRYRPKWDTTEDNNNLLQLELDNSNYSELRQPEMKRVAEVLETVPKVERKVTVKPQPKWKFMKGRVVGSHMVCYFKLCAFRSPI